MHRMVGTSPSSHREYVQTLKLSPDSQSPKLFILFCASLSWVNKESHFVQKINFFKKRRFLHKEDNEFSLD